MPPGIAVVGDDVYFEEFQPGSGVAAVGIEDTFNLERKSGEAQKDPIF
jgi:hypothetical protein